MLWKTMLMITITNYVHDAHGEQQSLQKNCVKQYF